MARTARLSDAAVAREPATVVRDTAVYSESPQGGRTLAARP